ncbi:MAG: hypothetical protein KatS3mg010_1376 [Acidimicrobiia bacterium]|jgi:small subunit ribosomal protein S18|nr:MAG: hypothetical protein KatS3mg010_1376 [Acidimicrobiia bacterium]
MPKREGKKGAAKERRPVKKKTSILVTENVEWIDYKDVNLLRRFMSERAKIRARRVTGNDQQQQAAVARAIKIAREMALLPYSVRQVTQRSKSRRERERERDARPAEASAVDEAAVAEATEPEGAEEVVAAETAATGTETAEAGA